MKKITALFFILFALLISCTQKQEIVSFVEREDCVNNPAEIQPILIKLESEFSDNEPLKFASVKINCKKESYDIYYVLFVNETEKNLISFKLNYLSGDRPFSPIQGKESQITDGKITIETTTNRYSENPGPELSLVRIKGTNYMFGGKFSLEAYKNGTLYAVREFVAD